MHHITKLADTINMTCCVQNSTMKTRYSNLAVVKNSGDPQLLQGDDCALLKWNPTGEAKDHREMQFQGPVSQSPLWKVTIKFSFTKPPLTLLTKGLPGNSRSEQMSL